MKYIALVGLAFMGAMTFALVLPLDQTGDRAPITREDDVLKNGISLNGINLNGINLNGILLNGAPPDSSPQSMTVLESQSVDSVVLDGSQLVFQH